ncbi:hypothetical protein J2TS4_05090 [Paenibacillus sp. J2TS4]|nr:hypothetical protein J2TS4_05090 [Paenibacillus sp. J2TS4]
MGFYVLTPECHADEFPYDCILIPYMKWTVESRSISVSQGQISPARYHEN